MKRDTFTKLLSLIFCSCIFLSLTGCDQISAFTESFKEYFGSKEKSEPVATSPAAKPAQPSPTPQNKDKPLAPNELVRIGDWSITIEEFNQRLDQLKEVVPDYDISDVQSKALILEELIRQQLLVSYAEGSGLANRKDVKDAVEEFRRTLLVREVAVELTQGIEATEEEAQEYYNENKEAMVDPAEYRVREIVLETQDEAKAVLIELLKGEDFAEMAKNRSVSKTASKGGDLGFINDVPFRQMGTALEALTVGDISSVFRGPDGFYVIKLEESRGGEQKLFSEVKDEIKTGLSLLKQQQQILQKIDEIQRKVDLKINEELLLK